MHSSVVSDDRVGLMSACEILSLYSQVNQLCVTSGIEKKKPKNPQFVALTRIMCEVKSILQGLTLRLHAPAFKSGSINFGGAAPDEILASFWSLYSTEEAPDIASITALYEMKTLPQLVETGGETEKVLERFSDLIKEFAFHVDRAVRPYNLLCCRTGCRIGQKGIFGTIDQLKFMLEKNFDGRHFWVKSQTDKNFKIDAMFFPATSEKVLSTEELK